MYVFSKCLDGVASILVGDGHGSYLPFTLVGSSIPTSATAGDVVRQLCLYPHKGQGGVVTISCYGGKMSTGECLAVRVHWKDDKVEVGSTAGSTSFRDSFFNPDRIGQLYGNNGTRHYAWIEVQIGKRRFTSNPDRVNATTHLVPDNDLLCRYWAGNAEPVEVIHAAVQSKVEVAKEELLQKQLMLAQGETRQLREEFGKKLEKLNDVTRKLSAYQSAATALAIRLRRRWFLSKKASAPRTPSRARGAFIYIKFDKKGRAV